MKFLADENIPLLMVRQLFEKGYDVIHIGVKYGGIPDEEVIDLANEEERIIVTFDSDFGNLVFLNRKIIKTGIIFLRLGHFMPNEPGDLLVSILEEKKIDFYGKISVVTKEKVRQRVINH
jgi:predicted nuclease of predicted toxin-antitoxin system